MGQNAVAPDPADTSGADELRPRQASLANALWRAALTPEALSVAAVVLVLSALLGNPAVTVLQPFFMFSPSPMWFTVSTAAGQIVFGVGSMILAALSLRPHESRASWVGPLSGASALVGLVVIVLAVAGVLVALTVEPATPLVG